MPKIAALGGMSSRGFGEFARQASGAYIEDVFSTYLYNGTDAPQTITNGIDLSGNGGLVWLKSRSGTVVTGYDKHILFDTVRTNTNSLSTNSTAAVESGWSNAFFRFRADGFDFGTSTSTTDQSYLNNLGVSYASWTFGKKQKFFDVVSYTGNGANRTIAHDLGSIPGMIIIKRTNSTSNWAVYHRSLANTQYLAINTTAAAATDATYWNSTTPTATNFSLGTSTIVNASGGTYVAYLFAHDAGGFGADGSQNVISCGSFTTAPTTGTASVTLGYEPQFFLCKSSSANDGLGWFMFDTMRGMTVAGDQRLYANTSGAEGTIGNSSAYIAPTATGVDMPSFLSPSTTYIYLAIRRGPMRTPTDATKVFSPVVYSGNSATRTINAGFTPDAVWFADRSATYWGQNTTIFDRLRGLVYSVSSSIIAESDLTPFVTAFGQSGINITNSGMNNAANIANAYLDYFFARAPGYMDVVCYTGTGSNTTQSHNLGVVPELIIIKRRSTTGNWTVQSSYLPNGFSFDTGTGTYGYAMNLNLTGAAASEGYISGVTSTVFNPSTGGTITNNSGTTYVAYLFASCPGVSKVGSYTGTGTTQQINCGFTAGARFVLIKRTDVAGGWYVYDSARGIVAGNDPYLLLNSTATEVTGTDYVDTYAAGFELSSTAPAGLNANGGSYLFLAIS